MRMLTKNEEERLIEEARRGCNNAFGALVEHYRDALKGFISSHLSPIQRNNDLEDLVQETLLEALKRRCTYDPNKGKFYTWLLIWARYALARYFKERQQNLDRIIIMSEIQIQYGNGKIDDNIYNELIEILTTDQPSSYNPQEISEMLDKFYCFLCIAFGKRSGRPHQQIAFGYIKLLGWEPRRIVAELSGKSLEELAENLENEYVESLEYAEKEKARKCFEPLRERMEERLSDVDTIVGETKLSDYWGDRPEDNLSNWCYRVRQRVIEEVRKRQRKRQIDC